MEARELLLFKPFRQASICSIIDNILVLDPMTTPLRHLSLSQNWAIFHLSTRSHEMFFCSSIQSPIFFHRKGYITVLNWFTELKTNGGKLDGGKLYTWDSSLTIFFIRFISTSVLRRIFFSSSTSFTKSLILRPQDVLKDSKSCRSLSFSAFSSL